MANHKWKDESISKYEKEHFCVKCRVYRTWLGGDMQCWQYWWARKNDIESIKKQFERPECITNKQ